MSYVAQIPRVVASVLRNPDLRRVELFPFDFAALDRLLRQSLEGGLLLKRETKRLHASN